MGLQSEFLRADGSIGGNDVALAFHLLVVDASLNENLPSNNSSKLIA